MNGFNGINGTNGLNGLNGLNEMNGVAVDREELFCYFKSANYYFETCIRFE